MFRFTIPHISKTQFLLQRITACGGPRAAGLCVSALRPAEYRHPAQPPRLSCPTPDPPKPPPPDDRWIWITATFFLTTTVFAVYARQNPEVRDWITIYAPWFDDMMAVVFREDYSYGDWAMIKWKELKQAYEDYKNLPEECFGPPVKTAGPCDPCELRAEYERQARELLEPCEQPPPKTPEKFFKDVCELEKCLKDYEKAVIGTLEAARDLCIDYNKTVEKNMTTFDLEETLKLKGLMEERKESIDFAWKTSEDIRKQIDEIQRYIDCGGVTGPADKLKAFDEMTQVVCNNIMNLEGELLWESIQSEAYDRQWKMVLAAVCKYTSDLQSFYPNLDFEKEKPNIDAEDLDFLLIYTLKNLSGINSKLMTNTCVQSTKVDRTFETLGGDEKKQKERKNQLNTTQTNTKKDLNKKYADREKQLKADLDKKHKQTLEEQKKQLNEENKQKMLEKEKLIQSNFEKEVAKKVAELRLYMKNEREEMQAKLDIVEGKLAVRLRAEREQRRSQDLWAAGASLLRATQKGDDLVRVDEELFVLRKAIGESESETAVEGCDLSTGGDKLLSTVLKSIPKSVSERGLVPESTLRRMYHNPTTIPQKEIDNPPKEDPITDLDTFELLQRARFYVNQGNIAAAMRYVNSLEGASKSVAANWLESARCLVQTRQAAETILAHASAMSMKYS